MAKEGSTKIENFMTTGAGVLVLGCGHISHIVKMHLKIVLHRSDMYLCNIVCIQCIYIKFFFLIWNLHTVYNIINTIYQYKQKIHK